MQVMKDGWALFICIALILVAGWRFFTVPSKPEPTPQPIVIPQTTPVQTVQYRDREPETRTVYLPSPQQQQPAPQAPPINISIIVDGKEIKTTPVIVEQGDNGQVVHTPNADVKQSHPCDDALEAHKRQIATWEAHNDREGKKRNGRVQ